MSESFFGFFRRVWLSGFPIQLVRAICVAAVFELLVYLINRWVRRRLGPVLLRDVEDAPAARVKRRRMLVAVPSLLVRGTLYVIALLMILRIFGLRTSAELIPIAFALIVIGLVAARHQLQDAMAGYLILCDHIYNEGDEVTLGEVRGRVEEITLRRTRLRTDDGEQITVPHRQVSTVINHSRATKPPPRPTRSE